MGGWRGRRIGAIARSVALAAWVAAGGAASGAAACAGAPDFMHGSGEIARREATLGWGLTITALLVSVVVAVLLLVACLRPRPAAGTPAARAEPGTRWLILGGIVIPTAILVVAFAFSLGTMQAVAAPSRPAAFTVRVIGHRWWWEVVYPGASPGAPVITANELHVPVGRPVRLELTTADVIHSFWVPQLAGKTDMIPGQHNVAWIEADTAGTYWEQCSEYCGTQHAHMAMRVVADPPARFAGWIADQARPAPAVPAGSLEAAGERAFVGGACSACHNVDGTGAHGRVGPDLTHFASRQTLAAGLLPNTRGNVAGWIANTQTLKPGSGMPTVPLDAPQLQAIVAYLATLR